ncbi:MAG: SDR family NAD(P)-dependent oxidoreductase [Nannocystaceae bacterium]
MHVLLFGATRGMGRAVARELARRGARLFLLGRDLDELKKSAADLQVHGAAGVVDVEHCDLSDPSGFSAAFDSAERALARIDAVVLTAGMFASQKQLEADPVLTTRLLVANFAHSVAFCEEARRRLLLHGGGVLCAFSSVAGDRGRKPVVLYGASKAGLSAYLEGLDHKFAAEGLRVVCVKPGFVRTDMTAGLKPPPFAGTPDGVAKRVVAALYKPRPVVYVPGMWRWVMLVIRWLPRFVMRRIGF